MGYMYLDYLINLRGEKKREKEKKKEKRREERERRKRMRRGNSLTGGRRRKERRGVFVAWEVLAGQAQGGAYHYRQDIP